MIPSNLEEKFISDFLDNKNLTDSSSQQPTQDQTSQVYSNTAIKQCSTCGAKSDSLLLCNGCKSVYYCNIECQKKHWSKHKLECKQIQKKMKELAKQLEEEKYLALGQSPPQRSLDHFINFSKIGEGNFSEIYVSECKFTKKKSAIKFISKYQLQKVRKEKDILMEKHCLIKLKDNPYVVQLYHTFQDDFTLYVEMEYIEGGELWHQIKIFGLLQLSLLKYYFAQLLNALHSIQSQGIVHRDLKTENIILTKAKKIKLVDFGTARDLQNPEIKGSGNSAKGKKVFEHFVGTPNFMAPECIRNRDSNFASDIWSLGCIVIQMITGFPAFLGASDYLIFTQSIEKEPIFPDGAFPNDLKELIMWMMKKDFNERPNIDQIKSHSFFQDFDFDNIQNYEFYENQKTQAEEYLLNAHKAILSKVKLNKEQLHEDIVKYKSLENLDLPEAEKLRVKQRLNLMEKQFQHYFNIQDFVY